MGEKKKDTKEKVDKRRMKPEDKKKPIAITVDPDVLAWVKDWAARRDRKVSWAFNYFAKERRNRELAEKHLGQKVVR